MTAVAFLGSHDLGVACLDRLHEYDELDVELVVTYPADADTWWDGSVRERATELGYDVLPLDRERELLEYPVDYLLSVYYPNILDAELLGHPREGALNLHQAELPRYRGSNVFSHAIMNARGDDHWRYGTTLHFMAEAVDAGDIVARKFVDIATDDTARSLYEKTKQASLELFEESLPDVASGRVHDLRTPQSAFDGKRYFYRKDSLDGLKELSPEEVERLPSDPALRDRIRALDFPPFEPAYAVVDGRRIYLTAETLPQPVRH